jgi:hypothetical protein
MSEAEPCQQAEIAVRYSGNLWVVSVMFPWCLGIAAAIAALLAIPLAIGQGQPLFLLLLVLGGPAIVLIRPAWAGSMAACDHPSRVVVKADEVVVVMPVVLPEPLAVPRRYIDSVWLVSSSDVRVSRSLPDVSGFPTGRYQWDPTVVVLMVANIALDTGKIPTFGLTLLRSNTLRYLGPQRRARLQGLVIPAIDVAAAWDAFADWPHMYGDPPDDVLLRLNGPNSRLQRLRQLFAASPGGESIPLSPAQDPDRHALLWET